MYGNEIDTGLSSDQIRDEIERAFAQSAARIESAYQDLFANPEDIEGLHRYRISLRVARSLAKFIAPYQKRSQNRALVRQLKTLQDPTSHIRELDVLEPLIQEHDDLHAICEERRLQLRKEFLEEAQEPLTSGNIDHVVDRLTHIAWKKDVARYGIDALALAGRVDAQQKYCEGAFAHLDFDDEETVHELRKKAKALRYVTRELRACLPESLRDATNDMREMQDTLGKWRDACVNADIVEKLGGEAGEEAVVYFREQAEMELEQLKALKE